MWICRWGGGGGVRAGSGGGVGALLGEAALPQWCFVHKRQGSTGVDIG